MNRQGDQDVNERRASERRALGIPESPPPPRPLIQLWPIEGCPDIAVGLEESGTVVIQVTEGVTRVRLWDPARVATLQQALDAAETESARIAARKVAADRTHRDTVLAQLYVDGPSRFKDLSTALPGISPTALYGELLRLRGEGKVTRYGGIWKLEEPEPTLSMEDVADMPPLPGSFADRTRKPRRK